MKVSDYIVSFLIDRGITDVFGYPGGMVTHLMQSFDNYKENIKAHVNYNEQGASFAACGYGQISLKPGVAYATSGPGATNLMTGIANAYFDSIPTLFITGQVNTFESKGKLLIRQNGFQEMNVVNMVEEITKFSAYVSDEKDIKYYLEKAFFYATSERPGPVLLDIPMNVQRAEVEVKELRGFEPERTLNNEAKEADFIAEEIYNAISQAKCPCILVGAGVKISGTTEILNNWLQNIKIPVVSSMISSDVAAQYPYYYGFVGAYGMRSANFILSKCDLLIALGSRLDVRQVGAEKDKFAKNARLIRIDVDSNELTNKIKPDEKFFVINLKDLIPVLQKYTINGFDNWLDVCETIRSKVDKIDIQAPNKVIEDISNLVDDLFIITTDVGQNQVWVAQSFKSKGQPILFSGGHGAMGYSLPAAIGAYYGGKKKVLAFTGDGGLQMNIQELQFIVREKIPVKIVLLNNYALGMIRHFQEIYFEKNYAQTLNNTGYELPDFGKIAQAYNIPYLNIDSVADNEKNIQEMLKSNGPAFIEIKMNYDTYVFPKLEFKKPIQDQEPLLDRKLYDFLENL